jgi:hypothetical protein
MPAKEGLGNHFNVVPIAAGVGLSLTNASGVTFICTGNDTFTLTAATTFAGSYSSPGSIIVRKYTNTSTAGAAKWVLATQSASNAVTIASGSVAFFVANESLPDTYKYVKVSAGAAGLVTAVFSNLYSARSADNLAAVGA